MSPQLSIGSKIVNRLVSRRELRTVCGCVARESGI